MPRRGHTTILHVTLEEMTELNLLEVCDACQTSPDFLMDLISYGTIEPKGLSVETFRFDDRHLKIIRTAMHLYHDLEINHAGIALAVDLIHEVEELRGELDMLKRFLSENR